MKFKSSAQRKAVMASMSQGRATTPSGNVPYKQNSKKNVSNAVFFKKVAESLSNDKLNDALYEVQKDRTDFILKTGKSVPKGSQEKALEAEWDKRNKKV